jgi:HAE1 family hydrophobic/amphiphilic exporter-1
MTPKRIPTKNVFAFTILSLSLIFGAGCSKKPDKGRVMGTTVIGGMFAASFLAIFLIPVTFYVVEKVSTHGRGKVRERVQPPQQPSIAGKS